MKQVNFSSTRSKYQKCTWPCYELELWPLTLKTVLVMATHMMIYLWQIFLKFSTERLPKDYQKTTESDRHPTNL